MSSALEHPQNSSSSSLPRVHRDSEDTSSQSQVTVKEKITKDIISKKISEAEVPFLPKVRGGLHLQLANELQHQERTHHKKKDKLEPIINHDEKKEIAARNYELSPDTTAGILEIFARSVDECLTVDKMWSELKADALKRLRPIILHSHRLNRRASPSAKECLEIYKEPTAIDKYTGKPIPLSQVLSEVTKRMYTSRGTRSAINVAMSRVARLSQMRAEMMLERKDPYNPMETGVHQNWYFVPKDRVALESAADTSSRPRTRTADHKKRQLKVRRIERGSMPFPKKHLPLYLTNNGNLLSASLEEFEGKVLYCTPSQRSKSEQQEDDVMHKDNSSSIFMTDFIASSISKSCSRSEEKHGGGTMLIPLSNDTAIDRPATDRPTTTGTTCSRGTVGTLRVTTCSSKITTSKTPPINGVRVTTWQPLNATALLEHTTINLIPIRGLGHLAHGHYHMWRPESCHSHTHIIDNY